MSLSDADSLLLPVVDEDGAPFWEYTARGELRVQACASPACGGGGRPRLARHGHCGAGRPCRRLAGELGDSWRVVAPDQRGHG
ncbi:hypothetical protein LCE32_36525, partial [Streptomyces sp. 7G]|uniref:alpha/beta fold hydrolase n=1 Tax=Streptomyces sp. 7G TaxID=2877241 RepID=UPI0035ABBF4B|nr:hypothetical protein [Streptomyces sp. 7G]